MSRGANDMMVAGKIEGLEDLQGGIANQVKVRKKSPKCNTFNLADYE